MDAKTLEALKASIAKWEKNAKAKTSADYSTHWSDCPLCLMFNGDDIRATDDRCIGCPVYEKSGAKWCEETPFYEAVRAKDNWHVRSKFDTDKAREAARAEVTFLKSLLPTEG